jgi:hypothetical protein
MHAQARTSTVAMNLDMVGLLLLAKVGCTPHRGKECWVIVTFGEGCLNVLVLRAVRQLGRFFGYCVDKPFRIHTFGQTSSPKVTKTQPPLRWWGIPPTREGLTSLMPATPGLTGLSRRLRDALRPWDMLSGYGCHAFVSGR